jgi:hypothetical protein
VTGDDQLYKRTHLRAHQIRHAFYLFSDSILTIYYLNPSFCIPIKMAPPAADVDTQALSQDQPIDIKTSKANNIKSSTSNRLDGPLKYSGSLDSFESFDLTAVIGREFPGLQLSEILQDDEKIRDLAVLGM